MVEGQLETRDISDPAVLDAFTIVPRHRFVPDSLRDWAYIDYPLPIGFEQTISQPYIVALMTQLVGSDSSSRVLEIGTGSGYQAAVLAEMVAEVYTIEIVEPLGKRAEALLDTLGYDNVFVRIGDGFKGWPEKAPFDGIVVTCAPPEIPQPLIDQLADNGRLVIPVGTAWQELLLVTKRNGKVIRESITPVRFVPMTGEAEKR
jgi:protein-L-isoaspartate(D-aspartate) O-methyltransferase